MVICLPKVVNEILFDMIARPIGLKILRPNQANRSWNIIRKKFRTDSSGEISGWGLIVFPKNERP